jgi:hypothetical protein
VKLEPDCRHIGERDAATSQLLKRLAVLGKQLLLQCNPIGIADERGKEDEFDLR